MGPQNGVGGGGEGTGGVLPALALSPRATAPRSYRVQAKAIRSASRCSLRAGGGMAHGRGEGVHRSTRTPSLPSPRPTAQATLLVMADAAPPALDVLNATQVPASADKSGSIPTRNHRLSITLSRRETLTLRAIADAWGVPVATAGYALLAERLALAERRAPEWGHVDGIAIAAAILARLLPRSVALDTSGRSPSPAADTPATPDG